MPKFALVVCVSALAFAAGCSSDSGDGASFAGGGIPGLPPNQIPGAGTGSTGAGGGNIPTPGGPLSGGQIAISPQQVQTIKQQSCAGSSVEGETVPSVLQLVVDVSSSMNDQAPGSNRSKWEVTRDALINAIPGRSGNAGLSPSLGVGLLFYPNRHVDVSTTPVATDQCVNTSANIVPALLGPANAQHRTLIRSSFEQVQLQSSTPTLDAYRYAFQNSITKSTLTGQKYMLLITDGTPTLALGCMNPSGGLSDVSAADIEAIVSEVKAARAAGIKTFLIGSPGSERNRNWLSRAAIEGGTAPAGCRADGPNYCHMDMTTAPDFGKALQDGLGKVVGQIAPCNYSFPPPPNGETLDSNKINVIVTSGGQSQLVVRNDVGNCTEGWELTDSQEIRLCPSTCNAIQQDASATVDVVFGCASLSEPPR
ncbi:MAG TPA: vWA domain-containing protein [Polyangiaceae bacterium]|nr:vWA domain-containing protein [Polyangiaceae bacterium]